MKLLQLLRQYPRYLAFGFIHYFFSFVGQTFFISLFVAGITAEYQWDTKYFAGIYSGVTLIAAFALPFVGQQIDRIRVRYLSTTNALVMISGCLLLGLSKAWFLLPLGLLAVRMGGQGIMTLTGSTTIGRFFTTGRAKALSFSILGISAAEVVVPPLATALITENGYRSMWLLAAGLLALVFIPLVWLLIQRHDHFQKAETVAQANPANGPEASWTRKEVLRDRRFQLVIPTFLFLPFFFTGFVFNQSDIALYRDYTLEWMAIGLSVFGLVRMFMILFAGVIVDRLGPSSVLTVLLVPILIGLALFITFSGYWVIPAFFGLMGLSAGMLTITAPTLWADRYGPRFLGSIKSTVKLLEILVSAAAPLVFAWGLGWNLDYWLIIMGAYILLSIGLTAKERRLLK